MITMRIPRGENLIINIIYINFMFIVAENVKFEKRNRIYFTQHVFLLKLCIRVD
jgi:hypothetical protein